MKLIFLRFNIVVFFLKARPLAIHNFLSLLSISDLEFYPFFVKLIIAPLLNGIQPIILFDCPKYFSFRSSDLP